MRLRFQSLVSTVSWWFLALASARPATAALPSLYQVQMQQDQLVASPTQKARVQALRVVDSIDCNHKVMEDSRVVFQGPCNYLSALFHYVPVEPAAKGDSPRQITGGFSVSRKNSNSYILAVAKPIEFHQRVGEVKIPSVKSLPIPQSLKQ
jgi:hypothetical protein